jgi:predicted lipoprotein with Yx(FWY)xxD motif
MLNYTRPWRPFLAVMSFALLAACSHHEAQQSMASPADSSPTMMEQTSTGTVMTTSTGMTVYTFDKDIAGKSNCTGECAQYWPPLLAAPGSTATTHMTLITRDDGKMQWATANGMPLYTYEADKARGDTKGDNFHNEWHVVK